MTKAERIKARQTCPFIIRGGARRTEGVYMYLRLLKAY